MLSLLLLAISVFCHSTLFADGQPTISEHNDQAVEYDRKLEEYEEKLQSIVQIELSKIYPPKPLTSTCRTIKNANVNAPSGMYNVFVNRLNSVQAYCEMGLNGGGYTFLTPEALSSLTNAELQIMFTDTTSFVLRVRKTDGTQPYAVLKQLPQYASIPLKVGLNDYTGYNAPVNINSTGHPFLYFGFLPKQHATNNNVQGLQVNGVSSTFTNADKRPNSYFTLFPNFKEVAAVPAYIPGSVCQKIWSNLVLNPSGRVMPPEIFMFGETHWGGGGCYQQTNQIANILSFSLGFR